MAREFAQIRLDMLADARFRSLSEAAQRLYMILLAVPSLSYAGVADWRPNRLAGYSSSSTIEGIEAAASELSQSHYVVVNEEFEEILVRSLLKYDGIMRQPRLAVSMANAYAEIMSDAIRSVIVFELLELREEQPKLACWDHPKVAAILGHTSQDAKALAPYLPPLSPALAPDLGQTLPVVSVRPITVTTTATSTGNTQPGARKPPRSYPKDFEEFWTVYPRKEDKPDALKAYQQACKSFDAKTIQDGVQLYALANIGADKQFVKMPAGWLRGERWASDPIVRTEVNGASLPLLRSSANDWMQRGQTASNGGIRSGNIITPSLMCEIHPDYPIESAGGLAGKCTQCERSTGLAAGVAF